MGLAGAPATESIMSALPPARANVGSAVNDATRELGGALGVAVVGSILADMLGGGELAALDGDAYVGAMARGAVVAAVVTVIGAAVAWRGLPARGRRAIGGADRRIAGGDCAASRAP
jgi:hypothetical protein